MEINPAYIKANCCYICKNRIGCDKACAFYVMAAKYHAQETILSAVCRDPETCKLCEKNAFQLEVI